MKKPLDSVPIIDAYQRGMSLFAIAKEFNSYPTTIKRILERNGIELRHDGVKKGEVLVGDGEKLIEWAKTQGRLVSKAELARVIGKHRLSDSYFVKYPELGQYVKSYEQQELAPYVTKLYTWFKDNNISYKPNDSVALKGLSVQARLLDEGYTDIVVYINIKPKCVSKKVFNAQIERRVAKAKELGFKILFLTEDHFKDLDCLHRELCILTKE